MFLVEKSDKARIVTLARKSIQYARVCRKMIKEMVEEVKNPIITLLGLAYKGNVNDTRESQL